MRFSIIDVSYWVGEGRRSGLSGKVPGRGLALGGLALSRFLNAPPLVRVGEHVRDDIGGHGMSGFDVVR